MKNNYRFNAWHAGCAVLAFACAVCLVNGAHFALGCTFVCFVVMLALAEIVHEIDRLPARLGAGLHHRGAESTEQEALAPEISSPSPSSSATSAPLWCRSLPERFITASS